MQCIKEDKQQSRKTTHETKAEVKRILQQTRSELKIVFVLF